MRNAYYMYTSLSIFLIPLTFHSLGRCNFQTPLHTLSLFISTHCQPEIWMLFHGLLRSWKIQKVVVFEYKLWKVMERNFMTSKAYIPNVFCLFLASIYTSFASRQHGMIIFQLQGLIQWLVSLLCSKVWYFFHATDTLYMGAVYVVPACDHLYSNAINLKCFSLILFLQLESLPKEDLIKYVRKQLALSKQTKAKCDGRVEVYFYLNPTFFPSNFFDQ